MPMTTIHSKLHHTLSKHPLILNPPSEPFITHCQNTNLALKSPIFHAPISLSRKTHLQKQVAYARKSKRGSGYRRLSNVLAKVAVFLAANAKILPEPFDLFISELGGSGSGGGGGFGFWEGFKGGSSDGWRGKRKRKSGFFGVLVVGVMGLCLFLVLSLLGIDVRELRRGDVLCGVWVSVLALVSFGAALFKGFRRKARDFILGFCLVGALIGFGLRREDMNKWVESVRVCVPSLTVVKGRAKKW